MSASLAVIRESFRAEWLHLLRAPLFVILTIIQAITFLFLITLFGLTGSNAPTAIVEQDSGPYTQNFIQQLANTHHSFALRPMSSVAARNELQQGKLVAIITLPTNFSYAIAHGQNVALRVEVDNVNTDMTDDLQRALPSAIVQFGREHHLPGIRIQATEIDMINHDTGFIPYMVISGLVLDAFVIAGILSSMAVAREFEANTIKMVEIAPIPSLLPLLGRMLATDTIAGGAMLFPLGIIILGYHIAPRYPLEMVGVLLLCIIIFGCIGVTLGVILKRTLPVVSLIFGLSFPLYLCSNALEPQRFDGNLIWYIAHISPVYYAVGLIEQACYGLQVTPESSLVNTLILIGWAVGMLLLATALLHRTLSGKNENKAQRRFAIIFNLQNERWQLLIRRRTLPWLVALLMLLIAAGGIEMTIQRREASALQLQQQQQRVRSSKENQRETMLLNGYMQYVNHIITQDPHIYTKIADTNRPIIEERTQKLFTALNTHYKVMLLHYLYQEKFIDDDYRVVSLKGMNFHGCNLSGINLSDTDLSGANFSDADMRKSNLISSTLIGVNFSNTELMHADLKVTDMHNVDIYHADLTGADMAGMIGINVQQLLQAHSLAGTRLPDGSVQPGEVQDAD